METSDTKLNQIQGGHSATPQRTTYRDQSARILNIMQTNARNMQKTPDIAKKDPFHSACQNFSFFLLFIFSHIMSF